VVCEYCGWLWCVCVCVCVVCVCDGCDCDCDCGCVGSAAVLCRLDVFIGPSVCRRSLTSWDGIYVTKMKILDLYDMNKPISLYTPLHCTALLYIALLTWQHQQRRVKCWLQSFCHRPGLELHMLLQRLPTLDTLTVVAIVVSITMILLLHSANRNPNPLLLLLNQLHMHMHMHMHIPNLEL